MSFSCDGFHRQLQGRLAVGRLSIDSTLPTTTPRILTLASLFITRPARSEMTVTGSVFVKLPLNKPIAKATIKQTATIIAKPVSGRTALLFIDAPPSPTG
jgi:hypothetical protein